MTRIINPTNSTYIPFVIKKNIESAISESKSHFWTKNFEEKTAYLLDDSSKLEELCSNVTIENSAMNYNGIIGHIKESRTFNYGLAGLPPIYITEYDIFSVISYKLISRNSSYVDLESSALGIINRIRLYL